MKSDFLVCACYQPNRIRGGREPEVTEYVMRSSAVHGQVELNNKKTQDKHCKTPHMDIRLDDKFRTTGEQKEKETVE